MPGLFGFPSMIERAANTPAIGVGGAATRAMLAGRQAHDDAGARQGVHQHAIDRLMEIGGSEASEMAQLISTNPRAAQTLIEQQGGPDKYMQRLRAMTTFGQATQAMAEGGGPNDILMAAAQGGSPGTAMGVAQFARDGQGGGRSGAEFVMQEMQDGQGQTGIGLYRVDKLTGQTERVGDAPPKRKGMEMQFDPETGQMVSLSEGGYGGPGGGSPGATPTNPVRSQMQKDLLSSGDAFARLDDIRENYDRDYLKWGTQLTSVGLDAWEKLGGDLTPAQEDFQDDYHDWQAGVYEHLNLTLKELSGAAVNEHEMARLRKQLPTVEDGPREFKSKLDRAMRRVEQYRDRRLHALAFGMTDVADFSLRQFKEDQDRKIGELMVQAKAQGMSDEDAEAAAADQYLEMIEAAG